VTNKCWKLMETDCTRNRQIWSSWGASGATPPPLNHQRYEKPWTSRGLILDVLFYTVSPSWCNPVEQGRKCDPRFLAESCLWRKRLVARQQAQRLAVYHLLIVPMQTISVTIIGCLIFDFETSSLSLSCNKWLWNPPLLGDNNHLYITVNSTSRGRPQSTTFL